MTILALDFGSSSVKAAILKNGRVTGKIVHGFYKTHFDGIRAELDSRSVFTGLADAIGQLGAAVGKVDHIALDAMAPSWVAMDKTGKALTPIITHQDRRSVAVAHEIEKRVGKARHLKLSGNRPIPGGISSTTWAWYARNQPGILKKADLVGHLSTLLHRRLTGARVTDPSNASFMGLYSTLTLGGWNEELCQAVGADEKKLPEILEGDRIAGRITPQAARRFGLTAGTPMLTGIMDTSSALLLRGAAAGQMLNVCGSTDVLAICTEHPRPDEQLLTRAVGIGRKWMQVSTIAAAGSALLWANRELFADLPEKQFHRLLKKLARNPVESSVVFDPYLAGDRTSLDQKTAAFRGLTLATTRDQMLSALVEAIVQASARRLNLLRATGTRMKTNVLLSGGLAADLSDVLHRDWKGRWTFSMVNEATLLGLGKLVPASVAQQIWSRHQHQKRQEKHTVTNGSVSLGACGEFWKCQDDP
jgi:xylulokinase